MRTQAVEILNDLGIRYEIRSFDARELTAEEAARKLSFPLHAMFKTLVVMDEAKRCARAIIPGDKELSLKKLAAAMKSKKVELVPVGELQRLTGYVKGGVSPLGGKRKMPLFLDRSALSLNEISVSAGLRCVQIILAPQDLVRAGDAQVVELV